MLHRESKDLWHLPGCDVATRKILKNRNMLEISIIQLQRAYLEILGEHITDIRNDGKYHINMKAEYQWPSTQMVPNVSMVDSYHWDLA